MVSLLITSEHGGNRVPVEYRKLFRGARNALESHRGYDPGSLELATALAEQTHAPLVATEWTRLLVEVNRSPGHPRLFSEFTRALSREAKQVLLSTYYHPHRQLVERALAQQIQRRPPVVHIGAHTFSPTLDGKTRNAEIGLLYDPARKPEREFCRAWSQAIKQHLPDARVRRNYPYLGKSDGLATHLRRVFTPGEYVGIELEVNQALPLGSRAGWKCFLQRLADSLIATCQRFDS